MPPSRARLHLALFSVALIFSVNYIISKVGMRAFAPLSFAWLRIAGGAVVMAYIARNEPPLDREDTKRLVGFATLGVAVNASLFLCGLALTTVQVAAILITTIPVFTLGAAIVLGRERATASKIGGIVLAGAGALLIIGGEGFTSTWRSVAGALMIVTNCLSFALYLVVSKPVMSRLSARLVVARMFRYGAMLLFPVALWSLWHERWTEIPPNAWIVLLVVIAGPTIGAYMLNAWALRWADASAVAAYTYVQPVLATILGAFFLDETIRPIVILAGLMIFAGVWLAGRATGPIPE